MLIDSHAHLDMVPAEELPQVLARAHAAGVRTILAIGIGDGPRQMHRALEIAEATASPDLAAGSATALPLTMAAEVALVHFDLAEQRRCIFALQGDDLA
jgi:Tat protein secretion system quality control protein TatD with DNase activity